LQNSDRRFINQSKEGSMKELLEGKYKYLYVMIAVLYVLVAAYDILIGHAGLLPLCVIIVILASVMAAKTALNKQTN
jgi:antibiotic biosynthesis monooxygenase (ABM) superfamily enzyme